MSKKMLRGIATGILITTLFFAYSFYFTDIFYVNETPVTEKVISEQDVTKYLQEHNLKMIPVDEYEELVAKVDIIEKEKKLDEDEEILKEDTKIKLIIEPGMSSSAVGQLLEEKDIITDKNSFENYIITKGLETKIRAGEYDISSTMSIEEIVDIIT